MQRYKGYEGYKHTLVATLGGKPQIITFTLDLLLKSEIPISEVIVLHPAASPRMQESLKRLNAEFDDDCYIFDGRRYPMLFRPQVVRQYDSIIEDIVDETTANGALDTIGELIRTLKRQQHIIHFSISGGRRLMSFLSFSAALLYFDTPDELLHLYTPEDVQKRVDKTDAMHIEPEDGRRLISVPFARAAQPFLALMLNRTPSATIESQREQQKAEDNKHCQQVIDELTETQRKVLQALARGLHPEQVAQTLGIKLGTIRNHTNVIYRECRNAWNMPDKPVVNYLFVQAKFANFFPPDESILDTRAKEI